MGELGRIPAQRAIQQDLLRRVADVVAAASHERHLHFVVVDRRSQVVQRVAVGSDQHEILLRLVRRADVAKDAVVELRHPFGRRLEADDVGLVGLIGAVSTSARVDESGLRVSGLQRFALCVELFLGAVAAVGFTLADQAIGNRAVQRFALTLEVRPEISAHLGTLVPIEA
jgi:hypothetical protein